MEQDRMPFARNEMKMLEPGAKPFKQPSAVPVTVADQIVSVLKDADMTTTEIAHALGCMRIGTVAGRVSELKSSGVVFHSGNFRMGDGGRTVKVWCLRKVVE